MHCHDSESTVKTVKCGPLDFDVIPHREHLVPELLSELRGNEIF